MDAENQLATTLDVEENAKDFTETSDDFQEVMKDICEIKAAPGKVDEVHKFVDKT